jgi:hypothetical protein
VNVFINRLLLTRSYVLAWALDFQKLIRRTLAIVASGFDLILCCQGYLSDRNEEIAFVQNEFIYQEAVPSYVRYCGAHHCSIDCQRFQANIVLKTQTKIG